MKKTTTLKNSGPKRLPSRGFTLIEMIGVLAVIAILASLLIPKVFNAINDARINNAIVSYETVKAAVTDHYGKYGALNNISNTVATAAQLNAFDTQVLLAEGLIDKPFATKIGTEAVIQVVPAAQANGGAGYLLDGTNNATANMTYVCEAKISGVLAQDAFDLSTRLDGAALTGANSAAADTFGRVEYAGTFPTTVYMYITGR